MNDFTKEELQYILEIIDSISIVNRQVNEDALQEKLQSLIDNSCEQHEADEFENLDYCKHCGVKFR